MPKRSIASISSWSYHLDRSNSAVEFGEGRICFKGSNFLLGNSLITLTRWNLLPYFFVYGIIYKSESFLFNSWVKLYWFQMSLWSLQWLVLLRLGDQSSTYIFLIIIAFNQLSARSMWAAHMKGFIHSHSLLKVPLNTFNFDWKDFAIHQMHVITVK